MTDQKQHHKSQLEYFDPGDLMNPREQPEMVTEYNQLIDSEFIKFKEAYLRDKAQSA